MTDAPENLAKALEVMTFRVAELEAELEAKSRLLNTYKAMLFGRRSEKARIVLDEQGCLDLGDLSAIAPAPPAANDDPAPKAANRKSRRNIGALPKHLPRIINVIEPDSTQCACCQCAMHKIGEDVSEALDIVPAILRVIATVRPKYACRACEGGIVQAPAPRRMIEGSMVTTSFIAWVVSQRFAWYLPVYRQAQMLSGHGLQIDRSTLSRMVKRAAWWLDGLFDRQLRFIHSHHRIYVDETRMPVLEAGRGQVRIDQFWAHGIDDRSWNGPAPPAVCYIYASSRSRLEITKQLASYKGVLQVDGYTAYKHLVMPGREAGPIQLAFCLAHLRRRFVDLHKSTKSPLTEQFIALFGQVYRIEADIRGTSAEHRRSVRQEQSRPVMEELKALCDATLPRLSAKSQLAEHIRYAHDHWHGLTLFLEDGRIDVDSNMIERQMRPVAIGRRNSLFAGNEGGARSWAVLASLLQTAKLNGLDPFTWLDDVLTRIVSGEVKNNDLDQLLAWNWKPAAQTPQIGMAA
ncbi:Mobile element protein [Sphingobium indicum BiD32]|uniref:Mobile element protein n=2 Tax=Sphingobium indicum TaxID=332055 RepID=N1MVE9_9SPHN|nr:IS66 family transposase [Sphingobium indicum]CCW19288.1 Mobile element protein [Sphingobium indicum BiD32]